MEKGIVHLAGERARIFIGVAQVGPADIVHKKQIAGENGERLGILTDQERKAVGRMAGRFEELDLE